MYCRRGSLHVAPDQFLRNEIRMKIVDLRSFLENWPYDAENNVRVARCADGREIIPADGTGTIRDRWPARWSAHAWDGVRLRLSHARINAAKQSNALIGFDLRAKDCAELF